MKALTKILTYIVVGGAVLLLGGLAGWYFFLSNKTTSTSSSDTAHGIGTAQTPSFGGAGDNTQSNSSSGSIWKVNSDSQNSSNISSSQLWEVEKTPVAGFGFVSTGTTSPKLYYALRANGYIVSADLSTRSSIRVTNELHPKLYSALFTPKGYVLERTINDKGVVTTFAGTLKTTVASGTTSTSLGGLFLPDSILSIAINPTTQNVFYLTRAGGAIGAGTVGTTSGWDGSKQKQVFSSLIVSWNPLYLSDGRIILTEDAADNVDGYAYQLNSDGTLSDLVRATPGLTIAPDPSTKALLYSQSSRGILSLFGKPTQAAAPVSLGLATVAEKCVWTPGKGMVAYCAVPKVINSQTFINDWYRGTTHTSDSWWLVNISTGTTTQIYSPATTDGVSLDVKNPQMDSTGTYIAFTNATDNSLWVLKVTK